MKKSKLIATLCTLVLTLACLTFGVYSAVKTSFTASGSITFNNYGIDADITIDIYGVENGTAVDSTDENYGTVTGLKKRTVLASTGSTATARSAYQANVITTTSTLSLGELKFDELNTTVTEEWASKIVLVISFTNYSKFDAQLSITQESAAITNLTATYGSKIKATESDGTTGVVSTSSLTITLTPTNTSTVVSGTFNPQISLEPFKLGKGDLITMDLVEGTETVTGLADTYRILNINGNNAEVVAMYDLNKAAQPFGSSSAYSGSALDTYLNQTWYGTLSQTAQTAIVTNNITQYSYSYGSSGYNATTHASYADYSSKAKVADLTRRVYALDVEDVYEYFKKGDGTYSFSTADIWKLFWDTETKPSSPTDFWFRSGMLDSSTIYVWYVIGRNGYMQGYGETGFDTYSARPAFKIDLSKITWTAA